MSRPVQTASAQTKAPSGRPYDHCSKSGGFVIITP